LNEVWGYNAAATAQMPEMRIYRLRQKIELNVFNAALPVAKGGGWHLDPQAGQVTRRADVRFWLAVPRAVVKQGRKTDCWPRRHLHGLPLFSLLSGPHPLTAGINSY
jgi:hypothetical protein